MLLRHALLLLNAFTIGTVFLIDQQFNPRDSNRTYSGVLEMLNITQSKSRNWRTYPNRRTWDFTVEKYLEKHEEACIKHWSYRQELPPGSKPLCDCVPDTLFGFTKVTFEDVSLNHTANENPGVMGGHWEPSHCTPRYSLVVVIPFRDRASHLRVLLHYLHPILQAQQLNYTIVVVEQKHPVTFNKAALMNIGYNYSISAQHNPDCVVFHDVDHIPENGRHMYVCQEGALHLGAYHSRHDYRVKYWNIFGAVTAFRPSDFEKVNGFSNRFFGWGGEDDEMSHRVRSNKLRLLRDPRPVSGYKVIPHGRDKGNRTPGSYRENRRILRDSGNSPHDGLNSLKFKLLEETLNPLFVLLEVDVLNDRRYLHKH